MGLELETLEQEPGEGVFVVLRGDLVSEVLVLLVGKETPLVPGVRSRPEEKTLTFLFCRLTGRVSCGTVRFKYKVSSYTILFRTMLQLTLLLFYFDI